MRTMAKQADCAAGLDDFRLGISYEPDDLPPIDLLLAYR